MCKYSHILIRKMSKITNMAPTFFFVVAKQDFCYFGACYFSLTITRCFFINVVTKSQNLKHQKARELSLGTWKEHDLHGNYRKLIFSDRKGLTYYCLEGLLMLGSHRGDDIHRLGRRNLAAPDSAPKFCHQSITTTCAHSVLNSSSSVKRFY